jgi:hypothetical protein
MKRIAIAPTMLGAALLAACARSGFHIRPRRDRADNARHGRGHDLASRAVAY